MLRGFKLAVLLSTSSNMPTSKNLTQAIEWYFWCHHNVFESILNPFNHCAAVHPCVLLALILTTSWKIWELFLIQPFWVHLKISFGGNFVPSAHTVTTRVPFWCHLSKFDCWLFFFLFHSNVFLEWKVKNTGVCFMLMIKFGSQFHSFTFEWTCFFKSNTSALAWNIYVSWILLLVLKSLALCEPENTICLCPFWFVPKDLLQDRCLARYSKRSHNHPLLVQLKDISKELIVNRQSTRMQLPHIRWHTIRQQSQFLLPAYVLYPPTNVWMETLFVMQYCSILWQYSCLRLIV